MKSVNMKTWEVQAILDNRKTVMRRVVKPQNKTLKYPEFGYTAFTPKGYISIRGGWKGEDGEKRYGENFIKMPYCPGDILYVWETFCPFDSDHVINGVRYAYKADSTPESERDPKEYGYKWHPSIHMPREAARIFLLVTGVRVERLQDISAAGAIAEGVCWEDVTPAVPSMPDNPACDMDAVIAEMQKREERELIGKSYGTLWNSTLKPKDRPLYNWEANPWCWVVEFERISREEALHHIEAT